MQVAKQVLKPEVANQKNSLTLIKQSEKKNVEVTNVAEVAEIDDANKKVSFNRFLEAYGDCV